MKTVPVSDFAIFHQLAAQIAAGGRLDPPLWERLGGWGYPVALGFVYRLLGTGTFTAELFNLLLGVLSVLLLAVLTARVAGRRAAMFAGLLFLCWPEQLVLSSVLASEHLAMMLTLIALVLLVPTAEASRYRSIAAGAVAGLAVVVRPALASLAVAGTVSLLLNPRSYVSRAISVASFVIALLATVVMWNGCVSRTLVAGELGSGWYSLMVGANASTGGKWSQHDLNAFASRSGWAQANEFARGEALRRIKSLGPRYASLMLQKMGTLWWDDGFAWRWSTGKIEGRLADSAGTVAYRGAAVLFHGLVWVLAIIGAGGVLKSLAFFGGVKLQGTRLLVTFVASGTVLHGVLETQPRYHYALEPALLVLAAVALDQLLSAGQRWVAPRCPPRR